MTATTTETPWGETYDELAAAVRKDRTAPPVLAIAAFLHEHGSPHKLRALVQDAVDLNLRSHEPPRNSDDDPPREQPASDDES